MSDPLWYFAYGSNMHPATLCGRRGIVAQRAVAACLTGWQLVLDKPPLLLIGEAMANIVTEPAARVLGVAYAITAEDLAHLDLTEGVLIGNYDRIVVRVAALDGSGVMFDAFTLTSPHRDPTLRPSRRYMALLIEGAQMHGLAAEYVAWLRAHPAGEESPEAVAMRALVDQALKKEPR